MDRHQLGADPAGLAAAGPDQEPGESPAAVRPVGTGAVAAGHSRVPVGESCQRSPRGTGQ